MVTQRQRAVIEEICFDRLLDLVGEITGQKDVRDMRFVMRHRRNVCRIGALRCHRCNDSFKSFFFVQVARIDSLFVLYIHPLAPVVVEVPNREGYGVPNRQRMLDGSAHAGQTLSCRFKIR